MTKKKVETTIMVPIATLEFVQKVAKQAGVSTNTVFLVLLAVAVVKGDGNGN